MYDKEAYQTLNDLIGCDERKGKEGSICPNCGTSHTITEELLKLEAYKWLQELKKNPIEFQCEDEAPRVCDSLIRWIEYFFNIERDDITGEDYSEEFKAKIKEDMNKFLKDREKEGGPYMRKL